MRCGYGQPRGSEAVTDSKQLKTVLIRRSMTGSHSLQHPIILSTLQPSKLTFDRNNERKSSAQRRCPIITQLKHSHSKTLRHPLAYFLWPNCLFKHSHSRTNTYVFGPESLSNISSTQSIHWLLIITLILQAHQHLISITDKRSNGAPVQETENRAKPGRIGRRAQCQQWQRTIG